MQDDTLRRLQEADLLDQSLASKAEELRHALEDMSNKFTTQVCVQIIGRKVCCPNDRQDFTHLHQVSTVLNETFARENRKRKLWFAFLIFAEFALLWTLWSFANARANLIYQTTYYDPFSPALYATPPQSHISDLYYSNSLASIPTSTTPHHQTTSWNLFNTLASYFRVSINPFSGFLPLDPSISGYHTSLGPRSDALSRHGLASCIYHFISVFRHMYDQLLNIGLGTSSFAHGTLGGGVVNSGSGAWSNSGSQLYRVPT